MNSEPHTQDRQGGIPIIGRLTPLEFLGFLGLILVIAFGVLGIVALWPLLEDISAPGSGGGAQMLLAMFVFPTLFVSGSLALSGSVGFALLLRKVKARLEGRSVARAISGEAPQIEALRAPMQILTISIVVQVLCVLVTLFFTGTSIQLGLAVLFAAMVAEIVFLICLGMLAARLRKNWVLWVLLTIITPPFGPFVAYFMMRKAVNDAVGVNTNAT